MLFNTKTLHFIYPIIQNRKMFNYNEKSANPQILQTQILHKLTYYLPFLLKKVQLS